MNALARCESCGRRAEVVLADGSTWCLPCHASALNLGYDTDLGTLLATGEAPSEQEYGGVRLPHASGCLGRHDEGGNCYTSARGDTSTRRSGGTHWSDENDVPVPHSGRSES